MQTFYFFIKNNGKNISFNETGKDKNNGWSINYNKFCRIIIKLQFPKLHAQKPFVHQTLGKWIDR